MYLESSARLIGRLNCFHTRAFTINRLLPTVCLGLQSKAGPKNEVVVLVVISAVVDSYVGVSEGVSCSLVGETTG